MEICALHWRFAGGPSSPVARRCFGRLLAAKLAAAAPAAGEGSDGPSFAAGADLLALSTTVTALALEAKIWPVVNKDLVSRYNVFACLDPYLYLSIFTSIVHECCILMVWAAAVVCSCPTTLAVVDAILFYRSHIQLRSGTCFADSDDIVARLGQRCRRRYSKSGYEGESWYVSQCKETLLLTPTTGFDLNPISSKYVVASRHVACDAWELQRHLRIMRVSVWNSVADNDVCCVRLPVFHHAVIIRQVRLTFVLEVGHKMCRQRLYSTSNVVFWLSVLRQMKVISNPHRHLFVSVFFDEHNQMCGGGKGGSSSVMCCGSITSHAMLAVPIWSEESVNCTL